MAEQTELRKLLVLRGPGIEAAGVLEFLQEHFRVEVSEDLDGALEAMRNERFDAVLSETADFLPLERGIVTQQASVVLETIGDGVCIVGPAGELVWANRRLRGLPPDGLDSLRQMCKKTYEDFASAPSKETDAVRRFTLMPADGAYYEVICSPIHDRQGLLRQVAAVVIDATRRRRQQLKLNAIDRAGRELVELDYETLSRAQAAERLRLLEERVISCSRNMLTYEHFTVYLLDEKTNRLELAVSDGEDADTDYALFASTEGNGICGYVAATGRSYICPDVRSDPRYIEGLPDARSSLTVPLRLHDRIIGVLSAESSRSAAFTEEDRQFAEIFAHHVAMALHILNLLVFERRTAHTEVSGSIFAELAGPLNDIITEASDVMEDYIGHDDLRRRLGGIIDTATRARGAVQELTQASRKGVLTGAAEPRMDPLLAGKRVLVADDEDVIRHTIQEVLGACGCAVDTARDGAEAAALVRQVRYDLVISDIKMPGANGYEVFAAAKEACPETEVILITAFGYDPHHSIVRASGQGLAAVLTKPFKVNELLSQCRAALAPGDE